jgi:hypothetical protein
MKIRSSGEYLKWILPNFKQKMQRKFQNRETLELVLRHKNNSQNCMKIVVFNIGFNLPNNFHRKNCRKDRVIT